MHEGWSENVLDGMNLKSHTATVDFSSIKKIRVKELYFVESVISFLS